MRYRFLYSPICASLLTHLPSRLLLRHLSLRPRKSQRAAAFCKRRLGLINGMDRVTDMDSVHLD